jgi:hypothetical protein
MEMVTTVAEIGRSSFVAGRAPRAADAALLALDGVVIDRLGNLFIAEPDKRLVRKVTPKGASSQ